ncbi:MAG: hypothetical protein U9Q74_11475 [Gemmatimonadota bacterium]|nr:hypothetical protein [Gemmatimonadota bacterium]
MSITRHLSDQLHRTLGDDAGGELVTWMDSVDDHRAELRDLNALTTGRVEARFDQLQARFEGIDARFEQIDARFEKVDARFEQIDARFEKIDARFEKVDARFREVDARISGSAAELRSEMTLMSRDLRAEIAAVRDRVDARYDGLFRWSFVFWCGSVLAFLLSRP